MCDMTHPYVCHDSLMCDVTHSYVWNSYICSGTFICVLCFIRRVVLQCVAVCCSVLQCVAVCCSVLQCVVCCALFSASTGGVEGEGGGGRNTGKVGKKV